MTTPRKPGQRRTTVEKIEDGKARVERRKAAAAKADGARTCAARPNGPYGIDAPKKCTKPTLRPSAALCQTHEKMWRAEARRRAAARKGAEAVATKQPKSADAAPVGQPSRFASPELEAKARAKREAQRSRA